MKYDVDDNNFFCVQGWMAKRLGLKGNDLMIYAIVYGFTQTQGTMFTGSASYISSFTGATNRTVLASLKKLTDSGLIVKQKYEENGVSYCRYNANLDVVKNFHTQCNFFTGVMKKFHGGDEKISPNNIEYNIDNISFSNKDVIRRTDKIIEIENEREHYILHSDGTKEDLPF